MPVDPTKITDYNRTQAELEELLMFCILVANKNATTTSQNLERLLVYGRSLFDGTPFDIITSLNRQSPLAGTLQQYGFGCFNIRAKSLLGAAVADIDLKTCLLEELESLHGVGMKTARYFVLHSRKNARVACLDTHVLKWLFYYTGYEVPLKTPSRKKYLELEQVFLQIADIMKISPADLDLKIWNKQRGSDEKSLVEGS